MKQISQTTHRADQPNVPNARTQLAAAIARECGSVMKLRGVQFAPGAIDELTTWISARLITQFETLERAENADDVARTGNLDGERGSACATGKKSAGA
ncbi:MAG: hypothetical protein GY715_05815 [Planctomycetes bacterium]|nr:hypothetical protein [Planctomycetota bacterium]